MNTAGTEAESKEKHGEWYPMPELTITLTLRISGLAISDKKIIPWKTE
jgi:hypothetical protein